MLADTSMEVVLGTPFLTLSSADILFAERELVWRTYTAAEALSTTKRIEIIDKKEFTAAALHEVRILGYVVSTQGVRMEDERIDAVKT